MKDLLTNCVYLEDSGIELYGYKFYGSPWYPAKPDKGDGFGLVQFIVIKVHGVS